MNSPTSWLPLIPASRSSTCRAIREKAMVNKGFWIQAAVSLPSLFSPEDLLSKVGDVLAGKKAREDPGCR